MSLFLYKSNRIEKLAQALGSVLSSTPSSPLLPETIIVQSIGMRRWLSLELAGLHGICANLKFPFPKAFVDDLFNSLVPQPHSSSFFERGTMGWRILQVLPPLLAKPAFAPVQRYVQGHN